MGNSYGDFKVIRKILISVLSILLVAIMVSLVFGIGYICIANEDFITYVEDDVGNHITVASDYIYWTGEVNKESVTYLYKDFGVDYFSGDIDLTAQLSMESGSEVDTKFGMFVFSSKLSNYYDLYNTLPNDYVIGLYAEKTDATHWELSIKEHITGSSETSAAVEIVEGDDYYVRLFRDDSAGDYGTVYFYLYSDYLRTVLYDSISLALRNKADADYRYFYPFNSWGKGLTPEAWGGISSIEFDDGGPTLETWNYPQGRDWANNKCKVYGEVSDDGGSNVTAWFQYRETYPTVGGWLNSADNVSDLQTGDNISLWLTGLNLYPQEYQYRLFGYNDTANATGAIVYMALGEKREPTLTTCDNATVGDIWARVYAEVEDDGDNVSGCMAGFQYREVGDDNWLSTYAVHQETGDNYTHMLYGLSANTSYEFRAYGFTTDEDFLTRLYGYGDTIGIRTYCTISVPQVTTGGAEFIDTGTVSVNGTVDYWGGTPYSYGIEYKDVLSDDWVYQVDGYSEITYGFNYSHLLKNLETGHDYQYRAVAHNNQGYGRGEIKQFRLDISGITTKSTRTEIFPFTDPDTWKPLWAGWSETGRFVASTVLLLGTMLLAYQASRRNKIITLIAGAMAFVCLVTVELATVGFDVTVGLIAAGGLFLSFKGVRFRIPF